MRRPVLVPTVLPRSQSADEPAQRALERRAIEAVNWGLPAVSFDMLYQAHVRDAHGAFNQVACWSALPDWKMQTLTPNPDVLYVLPFINTKDAGPMVLEIPAADDGKIEGAVMDSWQAALGEVGPTGLDQGKGGKYLILPPGDTSTVPGGYIALRSNTYQGYALLGSVPRSTRSADVAAAAALSKRIRLYPFSQAARPPATTFVDATDVVFDATIPYDIHFFKSLDRMVHSEPAVVWNTVMADMLATIGIERGRLFRPEQRDRRTLEDAVREARAWIDARFERTFVTFRDGTQWVLPVSDGHSLDGRSLWFYFSCGSPASAGSDPFCLLTLRDASGQLLDGAGNYRLNVPAGMPASQFWTVAAYDRMTHSFIRYLTKPRCSSRDGLRNNDDGSATITFGPDPIDDCESNWVPTRAGGFYEVIFRCYGPETALLDGRWKLPDIERNEGGQTGVRPPSVV